MYRFTVTQHAPDYSKFASDAFDANVGKPLTVTMDRVSFPGTLVAAEVTPDGYHVALTIEVGA